MLCSRLDSQFCSTIRPVDHKEYPISLLPREYFYTEVQLKTDSSHWQLSWKQRSHRGVAAATYHSQTIWMLFSSILFFSGFLLLSCTLPSNKQLFYDFSFLSDDAVCYITQCIMRTACGYYETLTFCVIYSCFPLGTFPFRHHWQNDLRWLG